MKLKSPLPSLANIILIFAISTQLIFSQDKSENHYINGDAFTRYITFNGEQSLIEGKRLR